MSRTSAILLSIAITAAVLLFVGWVLIRWLKNSEDDPARLISKWAISVVLIGITCMVVWGIGPGLEAAFIVPITGLICGVILAAIWGPNIIAAISRPFENFYTGGSASAEPVPLLDIALARRKQGKFQEAVQELDRQLQRFPEDYKCLMLLAEIQAENLRDVMAAGLTIERVCQKPEEPAGHRAAALNLLADFHLKSENVAAARQALERILALCPETAQAHLAAQRLAHLARPEDRLAAQDRTPIHLGAGIDNVGLLPDSSTLRPLEEDLAAKAGEYVAHLEQHPLDNEVREKLAVLYAEHYGRLDLASGELEQLIQQPNAPAKQIAHWLNLLADLQVKVDHDEEAARQTLQRIVDFYPDLAAAENARQRLARLKLELKGREKSQAVKLGIYEQNIGLKKKG